jgi:phosphatidylglycerophosphate synthase
MRERFSFREIVSSLPAEKRRQDGTVTRFFHRPLSFPLAWFFVNTGFSPNAVTYLSIVCCLAGFAFTLVPSMAFHYAAVALFMLFGTLDCVDGNMARAIRYRKAAKAAEAATAQSPAKPPYGEWVDAIGGYFAYAAMFLGLGMSCVLVSDEKLLWLVISAVASAANLLMRLAFQSFRVVSGDASRSGVGSEKRLSEEIGITGWFQPLYFAGLLTGFLPWVLVAYAVVFCGGCGVTVLKLILKVERAIRD